MRDQFLRLLEPVYSDLERHCGALCWADKRVSHQDLLQETLTHGYQRLSQLKNEDSFKSWMYSIAIRCYRSERRKAFLKRTVTFGLLQDYSPEIKTWDLPPDHAATDLVQRALAHLKHGDRETLVLYYISGCTLQEICDLNRDNSLSATKSRLSRARIRMRQIVEKLENADSPTPKPSADLEVNHECAR